MAKKTHLSRGTRRDLAQVKAMAAVQYDPQIAALFSQMKGVKKTYRSDRRIAKLTAKGTALSAKRAVKPTKKIYRNALGDVKANAKDVKRGFSQLGDAADPYRAVTQREQAGYRSRVAAERASTLKQLTDRQLEAQAGRVYAVRQAAANRDDAMSTLRGAIATAYGTRGAFMAGKLAELSGDRAQRANARRLARIQSRGATQRTRITQRGENRRADQKAITDAAKAKAKAKKDSRASGSERRMFSTEYNRLSALATGNRLGSTRADLGRKLSTGVSGVSPAKNDLALAVALDMAYKGYVSPRHAHRMRQMGLKLSDVAGLVSPKAHRRAKRRQSARSPVSYGAQHG